MFTSLAEMLRILWRKANFHSINVYLYALDSYSFSFDRSLWWPFCINTASIEGYANASRIT